MKILTSKSLIFIVVSLILIYFIPFLIYFFSVSIFEFEITRSEATAMGMVWVLAYWIWFFNRNLESNQGSNQDSDNQDTKEK